MPDSTRSWTYTVQTSYIFTLSASYSNICTITTEFFWVLTCVKPRSGSHSLDTQVCPNCAMHGYLTSAGCLCSSIASLNFLRCMGWVIPRPHSSSRSLSSKSTWPCKPPIYNIFIPLMTQLGSG